ncbi:hypothetical protein B0H13DRAFT_2275023 [Mycena leptocephala]|nr:hypothetical protein B0H13DRAFT_2275023 [Mycena leptocephala]
MPVIRRLGSETTHVSDSELERQASRSPRRKIHTSRTTRTSICRRAHHTRRRPLSDHSNTQEMLGSMTVEPYFGVEARLIWVKSEITDLKELLSAALKGLNMSAPWRTNVLAETSRLFFRFAMQDAVWINDVTRRNFHSDLRTFIRNSFPDEPLREDREETIMIRPFRCIYVHYTSLEDWTDQCGLLRCNPSFQANHEERFDCVAINMDDPLTFGHMLFLFKCRLPSGRTEDMYLSDYSRNPAGGQRLCGRIAEFLKTGAQCSSYLDTLSGELTRSIVWGVTRRITRSI